jgi:ATP adenylyltransferase
MDQLWAPWRLDYVSQPEKGNGCFLCEAAQAADDREKLVLWRARDSFCLLNCWPYNNGHLMVAPVAHKADLADLGDDELLEQIQLLRRCQRSLTAAIAPAGFNIGLNLGSAGGAGVPGHMHWHVVPRWEGDTNFMPVLADTKVIPQSLGALWELLRQVDAAE